MDCTCKISSSSFSLSCLFALGRVCVCPCRCVWTCRWESGLVRDKDLDVSQVQYLQRSAVSCCVEIVINQNPPPSLPHWWVVDTKGTRILFRNGGAKVH